MVNLSVKQRRIIAYKMEGKTNKEIGALEYPKASEESQAVLVSRELKKQAVAQYLSKGLAESLDEFNINWPRLIKPLSDALNADKTVVHGNNAEDGWTEVVPDHTIRLAALKQAIKLLEQNPPEAKEKPINFAGLSEIELTQKSAIFRKVDDNSK